MTADLAHIDTWLFDLDNTLYPAESGFMGEVEGRMTTFVAKVTGLEPGEFVHTLGDAHLYLNHIDQAREQLTREPYPFPTLTIADKRDLFSFDYEDFKVSGYKAHDKIAAPIAV